MPIYRITVLLHYPLQLHDLAVSGNMPGFDAALTSLPDGSTAQIADLHPQSVHNILNINCQTKKLIFPTACMYVCRATHCCILSAVKVISMAPSLS